VIVPDTAAAVRENILVPGLRAKPGEARYSARIAQLEPGAEENATAL
jgi:hypothetical protein